MARVQEMLKRKTAQSAVLLRKLPERIRLEPVTPDVGRPYYRAVTNLDVLGLIEGDAGYEKPGNRFECFALVEAAGVESKEAVSRNW